jgi:hypothetical protein
MKEAGRGRPKSMEVGQRAARMTKKTRRRRKTAGSRILTLYSTLCMTTLYKAVSSE